ncbi:hypothetical protein [Methylosinus sp. Sm6]|uniref:hypothetical protein n=1 Tax=Methylosinus sp. Sm6 TaxID=2866948 RepID=UPI001C98FF58|nr:hypothetical protein [Methylosinus sp. Sm6]MBY6242879.1 hypothetical protein [Methylosinus sp. Sm6]
MRGRFGQPPPERSVVALGGVALGNELRDVRDAVDRQIIEADVTEDREQVAEFHAPERAETGDDGPWRNACHRKPS